MTDPRHAYASARLHARVSRRPGAAQWGALEASRTPDHYLDVLRAGRWLRVPEGPLARDADARERWLRDAWREACAEIGAWYGTASAPAFEWLAVLADLDALEGLRAGAALPAWIDGDPWLGPLARSIATVRADRLGSTIYAPLRAAWPGTLSLLDAWDARWRALCARAAPEARRVLAELRRAVVAASGLGAGARRDAIEAAAQRAFRRGAGTVAAGVAYLTFVALQLERVRGGVAARSVNGFAEVAGAAEVAAVTEVAQGPRDAMSTGAAA
jgi:hypothetical protein